MNLTFKSITVEVQDRFIKQRKFDNMKNMYITYPYIWLSYLRNGSLDLGCFDYILFQPSKPQFNERSKYSFILKEHYLPQLNVGSKPMPKIFLVDSELLGKINQEEIKVIKSNVLTKFNISSSNLKIYCMALGNLEACIILIVHFLLSKRVLFKFHLEKDHLLKVQNSRNYSILKSLNKDESKYKYLTLVEYKPTPMRVYNNFKPNFLPIQEYSVFIHFWTGFSKINGLFHKNYMWPEMHMGKF